MHHNFKRFLKNISAVVAVFVFVVVVLFLTPRTASAAGTNVTSTAASHWAWNDSIGWIDFYNTNSVTIASNATTTGYASSTAHDISLDCATPRGGVSVCGASNYDVYNPGNGNLTGWAWNNVYGWISFCGGRGTADCPGSIGYEVQINTTTGDFSGFAWNYIIGWISFNCADLNPYDPLGHNDFCDDVSNYKVNTTWRSVAALGYLDSSTYDTGVAGGVELNSIIWQGNLPGGTSVQFQIAASSSPSGPWNDSNFVGYDGTSNTKYPDPTKANPLGNPGASIPLGYVLHNNQQYFRYRVWLFSDAARTVSPRVDDVIVNWSP